MLTQFAACIAVLLLLATPLFYFLTKHYYAEDMIDIIEAVGQGQPIPALDLEEDIMHGIMIQFGVITVVLAVAIVLTVRFISRRLWKPFDETLFRIEGFRLEDGKLPALPESDVEEFARLNRTLTALMEGSLASYRTQKEFTENASHELQTPLAVFQSKLDLLLQQPRLSEQQAEIIQGLYENVTRLSRLNRNLLLLAKIDNRQYGQMEDINLARFLEEQAPFLKSIAGDIFFYEELANSSLTVRANRTLLEKPREQPHGQCRPIQPPGRRNLPHRVGPETDRIEHVRRAGAGRAASLQPLLPSVRKGEGQRAGARHRPCHLRIPRVGGRLSLRGRHALLHRGILILF